MGGCPGGYQQISREARDHSIRDTTRIGPIKISGRDKEEKKKAKEEEILIYLPTASCKFYD